MNYPRTQQQTPFATKIFAIFLLMFGYVGISQAIIIDFTGIAGTGTGVSNHDPYSEDGFTLDTPIGNERLRAYDTGNSNYRGSDALFNTFSNGTTLLTRSDIVGGLFDLLSIDFGRAGGVNTSTSISVLFEGTFADNTTISQTISGSVPSAIGFSTFDLNGFSGLTQVSWQYQTGQRPQFDNIVVSAVPLPAAVWLLGSGLLGLISFRRKQKV